MAEALAALAPTSHEAAEELLGAVDEERARGLDAALQTPADHALVWPAGEGLLRMVAPLRQTWDASRNVERRMAELRKARSALRDLAARAATTGPRTCADAHICGIIAEPRR